MALLAACRPSRARARAGGPRGPIALIALAVAAAAAALAGNTPAAVAQPRVPSEYEVKAAFLYNFAKFVEWPSDAFADDSAPLVVGVLGDDPFDTILDQTIQGKTVHGRRVVVRRLRRGQPLGTTHLLFISSSERSRLGPILESLGSASVLTVGEMERFAHQGGIISFLVEDNRVRFEINVATAERARLKISSRLLSLARIVRPERLGGKS